MEIGLELEFFVLEETLELIGMEFALLGEIDGLMEKETLSELRLWESFSLLRKKAIPSPQIELSLPHVAGSFGRTCLVLVSSSHRWSSGFY